MENSFNYPKYSEGSVWRKWDLHIHTPKSIIQNYGGDGEKAWDDFVNKLASLPPEIKVIGITDYLFCDGYEYLLSRRSEFPNIELMIPNIEFRLDTFSGTENNNKRHNFHVLFDPVVEIEDIRGQLLNCLSKGYKIQDKAEWQQTPTKKSLESLGKLIKDSAPPNNSIRRKTDLEAGFDNITYSRDDILKLLKKDCFKGKYVIAIGYSEWDQSRWDQSAVEKRDLINSAHFCLTCGDDLDKIDEHKKDLEENNLSSLILHSSDAHNIDKIGQALLWIKANPTFAGLKQVINEPKTRVFIGDSPPNYKPDHKVIKKISIASSNGWFDDNFELDLNSDLITIIGGRGSGKSALAEAIAYGAGSKDKSENAFFYKAAKHKNPINGAKISLVWADGNITEFEVGELTGDYGLVQYLPQGAVEDLCSHKNSEKLQKQIENVIFQALDETERFGSSNFDELKTRILKGFQYEKEQAIKKLKEYNRDFKKIMDVIRSLPAKEKLLNGKKVELERLRTTLPPLPEEDKKAQEELAVISELKKKLEAKIVKFQSRLTEIQEIEMKVKVFQAQIKEFQEEISILLTNIGITDQKAFKISINESGIETMLAQKKKEVIDQINILRCGKKNEVFSLIGINIDTLIFDNLQTINIAIEERQKQTKAFETVKLKYQQQKNTAFDLERNIKALEDEVAKIKSESEPEKFRLESGRMKAYYNYFSLLEQEKSEIRKLYKPLQDSLATGTDTDKKLIFDAKINYKLDEHYEDGLNILDRTRRGNFREIDSLKGSLSELSDDYYKNNFSETSLQSNLDKMLQQFTMFEEEEILIEDQLRENYTIEDFYNWLFNPSYFEIISSLKFDGTDLHFLSPGQKGTILLMLYLEIDKADYRPLIIDQPEENLDNLSVYTDLIDYFKDRKLYRQIIMVTHNPNLVVNTDAEQIIVANYDGKRIPRLQYCCGSLEDQATALDIEVDKFENGIIEQVCDILEGGEPAFMKRKNKYQISPKSQL